MSYTAEQSVLGCLLIQNTTFDLVAELQPHHFHDSLHRTIFSVVSSLITAGKQADPITVYQKLTDKNLDEEMGGMRYLNSLFTFSCSASSIRSYANIVLESFRKEQLRLVVSQTLASLDSQADPLDTISLLGSQLDKILENRSTTGFVKAGESLAMHTDVMSKRVYEEKKYIQTGLPDLDRKLGGGMSKGDLVVLAARPSMGKTAFSLTIALENAAKDKNVLFFSMEMANDQLIDRAVANVGNLPLEWVRNPTEEGAEWSNYTHAVQKIQHMNFLIDCSASKTLPEMRAASRKENRIKKVDLIIVDYLGLITGGSKESRNLELGEYTKGLKALAKELNCPVILLAQLNRGVEQRMDKRPTMSDLRDSGEIEADADTILMLYREEYYNPNTPDKGICEIICTKNRQGETGAVGSEFVGMYQQFRPLGYTYKRSMPDKRKTNSNREGFS